MKKIYGFPLAKIILLLLGFAVIVSLINGIGFFVLSIQNSVSPASYWIVWTIASFSSLIFAIILGFLVLEWLSPLTHQTLQSIESEINVSQKIGESFQRKWMASRRNRENKKHLFTSTLEESCQSYQSFRNDLQDILQLLGKMASSIESQSSNVKHMTQSLGEMSTTTESVTSHSKAAVKTSKKSEEDAKKGGEVVHKFIKHMNKITKTVKNSATVIKDLRKRSDEIVEIINVIDDIAEQTNLLALNAAIEAARAGPQGRGFAVVADQIRSLAEKTTHATKEIASTLSSIHEETSRAVSSMDAGIVEIDIGAGFAVQAGVSLRKIVAGAQRVTKMISKIAGETENQSNTVSSIHELVAEILLKTKSTCKENKDALAHIGELSDHAVKISKLLENFQKIWHSNQSEEELLSLGETTHKEIVSYSRRLQNIHNTLLSFQGRDEHDIENSENSMLKKVEKEN